MLAAKKWVSSFSQTISSVQSEYLYSIITQDVTLRPEATLTSTRFKFTLETVVSNVLVMQVCWEAVPNTWLVSSKAPVPKCVVCACNGAISVGG